MLKIMGAGFMRENKFVYSDVDNSAKYVRNIREKESVNKKGQRKDGQKYLRELIEWQESNS